MRTHRPVSRRVLALASSGLAALILIAALSSLRAAGEERTPWRLPEWKYRRPVLVYNASTMDKAGLIVALTDFPFITLINDGKLTADARDLRLVDENGRDTVPLRAEYLLNDTGRARLAFFVPEVGRGERKYYWLYYGNAQAQPTPALDPDDEVPFLENVGASCGAEESAAPEPAADAGAHRRWLAPYRLAEVEDGKIEGAAAIAKLTGPAGLQVSRGSLVAFRDDGKGAVTLGVPADAGDVNCWVRYCPSTVNEATRGALAVTLAQAGKTLVQQQFDLRRQGGDVEAEPDDDLLGGLKPGVETGDQLEIERTGYRWLSLRAAVAAGTVTVTLAGEKTLAGVDCVLLTKDLKYLPDMRDFQNRVWVRWRVNGPTGSRFFTNVDNQIAYTFRGAQMQPTGDVGRYGLRPMMKPPFPAIESEFIPSGVYSTWAPLPTSTFDTWFSQYSLAVPQGERFDYLKTRMDFQFATRPSLSHVFHISTGETAESGPMVKVRMPTDLTWDGVNKLETHCEWTKRRWEMVKGLNLGPAPHLKRLRVGAWINTISPDTALERLETEYSLFEHLGLTMVFGPALTDATYEKLAKEHGLIDINSITWPYIPKTVPTSGKIDADLNEWLERHVTQLYRDDVAAYKKNYPYAASITTRFNMGDEIGLIADAPSVLASPPALADFRAFLQRQGLTPQFFGMLNWDDVNPVDDGRILGRVIKAATALDEFDYPPDDPDAEVKNPGLAAEGPKFPPAKSVEAARLFYYTRRYLDYYTGKYYTLGTNVIRREFPKVRLISPNYQAAPMQSASIDIDLFYYSRIHAFLGLQVEDWVGGTDYGVGKECLGSEIMRSAARKNHDTLASLQVGGEAIKHEMYAYLMHGVKDNDSYSYGPQQGDVPWGSYPQSNLAIGQFTREVKPHEDAIVDGDPRPHKAALLVAYTADVMQQHGVGHCPLRQNTYIALEHSYLPVDVVCEQEITEDEALKNYRLLFVTDPQTTTAVQKKIAEWVKNGGRLWAGAGALNWDEFNQPCPVLNDVLGVARRVLIDHQVKDDTPTTTITAEGPQFGGKVILPVWGETVDLQPTTAKVLGRYADGKPAVTLNSYGKGEAMLVGALVGNSYTRLHFAKNILDPEWKFELGSEAAKLLGGLLAGSGVVKPVVLSIPGIYTAVWDTPRGTLVFLNNATYAALWNVKERRPAPLVTARIRVPGPVTSVRSKQGEVKFSRTGNEVTLQLSLPDTDILLLK